MRRQNFSRRELEIGRMLARSKSVRSIAEQLRLEPRTVYTHIENISKKTNTADIRDLQVWFKGWFA